MRLYHGTSSKEHCDSIIKNGFRYSLNDSAYYGKAVYGTLDYKLALEFVEDDDSCILQFDVDDKDVHIISYDELSKSLGKNFINDKWEFLEPLFETREWAMSNGYKALMITSMDYDEVVVYDNKLIKNIRYFDKN